MARMYGKENCTVFTWNADATILQKLATGKLSIKAAMIENKALLDAWRLFSFGPKSGTVEIEQADNDTDATDWCAASGSKATLVITTSTKSYTGSFGCTDGSLSIGDAIRSNATLESDGIVTIS